MRRRSVAGSVLGAALGTLVASAPSNADPASSGVIGYGAMPGGLHAPSAETLPLGAAEVATVGGFGWRKGLLGPEHRFARAIGDLAFAYAPIEILTVGLSLDGRYDRHFGIARSGDDGYVGDPHLMVRVAKASGTLRVGGQIGVWAPGKDAPSIAPSAISLDARGLVSLAAGPGLLSFSAGFRIDNSDKSVDDLTTLSSQDKVSLGVSEFHAVLAGVHLAVPVGTQAFVSAESSMELYVGEGATPMGATAAHDTPGPMFRFGASAGYRLTPEYSLIAFVEGAKVPGLLLADVMAKDVRLLPYEPVITGGLGFQARFGGPARPSGAVIQNVTPATFDVHASAAGEVVDEAGKPVVGAKVTIRLKNHTGTAVTDETGAWRVDTLPIGTTTNGVESIDDSSGEITIEVEGKKPAKQPITLTTGENKIERVALDPILPPGQLRAVVRSLATSKPVVGAIVTIEPGSIKVTSGADGTFTLDLAPGQYKITVNAPGLAEQQLDVTIDPNGVAIQNIDLHR